MAKKGELTPKQQRFVDEYLVDLNATKAAIAAGYSAKTAEVQGPRLLGNVRVAAAIQTAKARRAERVEVTQDYVLTNAREVVERCMERAPVMVREGRTFVQATDDDGNHVWQFDANGAVKALVLLAKHVGIGERPNVNINIDLNDLNDAQLEHLANGGTLATLPR